MKLLALSFLLLASNISLAKGILYSVENLDYLHELLDKEALVYKNYDLDLAKEIFTKEAYTYFVGNIKGPGTQPSDLNYRFTEKFESVIEDGDRVFLCYHIEAPEKRKYMYVFFKVKGALKFGPERSLEYYLKDDENIKCRDIIKRKSVLELLNS